MGLRVKQSQNSKSEIASANRHRNNRLRMMSLVGVCGSTLLVTILTSLLKGISYLLFIFNQFVFSLSEEIEP